MNITSRGDEPTNCNIDNGPAISWSKWVPHRKAWKRSAPLLERHRCPNIPAITVVQNAANGMVHDRTYMQLVRTDVNVAKAQTVQLFQGAKHLGNAVRASQERDLGVIHGLSWARI